MEFNGGGPHPKNTTVRSIGWNPECCSFFAPFISFWAPLAMDCSPETEKRSSFYLGDDYDLGAVDVTKLPSTHAQKARKYAVQRTVRYCPTYRTLYVGEVG